MEVTLSTKKIIIYGTKWCGDCYRARRILEANQIAFEWLDIDLHQEGEEYVLNINNGMRSVPTIVFGDGQVLVEPSNSQLREKIRTLNQVE